MVKVFRFVDGSDIEGRVNRWIAENEDVQIKGIHYSGGVEFSEFFHTVLIWYSK